MAGAGLYEVGAGKTHATIQAALDQLWADQSTDVFTETQYIRVFAGTYDENVEPNTGLVPAFGKYALIIEGDPDDSRDNIILAPTSGIAFQVGGPDYVVLRHMKIAPAGADEGFMVYFKAGSQRCKAEDLYIVGDILNPLYIYYMGEVENCVIETSRASSGQEGIYLSQGGVVKNCKITATTQHGIGIYIGSTEGRIEGCVISGFGYGILSYNGRNIIALNIRNTTIYNSINGLYLANYVGPNGLDMRNCIISTATTCILVLENQFPDESGGLYGGHMILRNNCFHSYTNFAYDGTTAKTYAEIKAMSRVDADDDLDATDPKMTDPGAADFTLQDASPCHARAIPAGVLYDVTSTAFRIPRCAIGAHKGNRTRVY